MRGQWVAPPRRGVELADASEFLEFLDALEGRFVVAGSKDRVRWNEVPEHVRAAVEKLAGGAVVQARNCPGGFSPGLASRLVLRDGRRVFAKAVNGAVWPWDVAIHRAEAGVAAGLTPSVAAPRLLGTFDDGEWMVLLLEDIDGVEPAQPWQLDELDRVAAQAVRLANAEAPSLPRDHPRLGGWAEMTPELIAPHSQWAAGALGELVALESEGLLAAQGNALVHFDLYPHNILLTDERVVFVDWPHARLGAPIVDLVMLLSSVAADRIDPEPALRRHANADAESGAIDAILAAHSGFLLSGAVSATAPGLEAIAAAKLRLGLGALGWLRQRLRGAS